MLKIHLDSFNGDRSLRFSCTHYLTIHARKTHSFFLLTQVRTNTAMQPTKPIALITMKTILKVNAAVLDRRVHTPHSGLHVRDILSK